MLGQRCKLWTNVNLTLFQLVAAALAAPVIAWAEVTGQSLCYISGHWASIVNPLSSNRGSTVNHLTLPVTYTAYIFLK